MIIGATAKRPVIFAFALLDRKVIYTGDAQTLEPLSIELPILIAIAAKPAAAIVMPLVGETHRNAVLAECPDFFDQKIVKLTAPFARQECFDGAPTLKKLGTIAPTTVGCVGKRNTSGVARIPCILGHSRLLRCRSGGKRR